MNPAEFSILANIDAFLIGMEVENVRSSKADANLAKSISNISEKIDADVRDVYDRLMPNVHILDAEYTARLLIRDLISHPEKYFSKIKVEEDGNIYDKDITSEYLSLARSSIKSLVTVSVKSTLRSKVIAAVEAYHKQLPTTKSKNPVVELNNLMEQPYLNLQSIISNPDTSQDVKVAEVARLGSLFRVNINKIFGVRTALMSAEMPELGSSTTRFVFFSKSFDGLSTKINKVISKAFIDGLASSLNINLVFSSSDEISVGSVIHFAHTALKSGTDSIINTPAYAKMIFNTANAPDTKNKSPFFSTLRASNHFKLKTGHVKVALKTTKELTSSVGILMQLGMTFTTDHSSGLNLLMSKGESKYGMGKYSSSQAATKATKEILSQRRTGSIIKALVGANPIFGQSSPSIMSMLTTAVLETLEKGKVVSKKYSNKKSKNITTKYYEPIKPTKLKPLKPLVLKTKAKKLPPVPTGIPSKATNLTNLQNLINSQLQDVISANMGDGHSKKVLNYRTGRFAASATVERMSESRAGMITAFYSYMKNPYQTFEPGFRQGQIASRDPKLLISRSIREIAVQQVGNRMRAVSV